MNVLGRRQRQAAQNYNHLAVAQRPNYKRRDAEVAARRLAERIQKERRIAANKGKGKK